MIDSLSLTDLSNGFGADTIGELERESPVFRFELSKEIIREKTRFFLRVKTESGYLNLKEHRKIVPTKECFLLCELKQACMDLGSRYLLLKEGKALWLLLDKLIATGKCFEPCLVSNSNSNQKPIESSDWIDIDVQTCADSIDIESPGVTSDERFDDFRTEAEISHRPTEIKLCSPSPTLSNSGEIHTAKPMASELVAQIEDRGSFWFDMELGIKVDGKTYSLLPILRKALGSGYGVYSESRLKNLDISGDFVAHLPDGTAVSLPFERIIPLVKYIIEVFGFDAYLAGEALSIDPAKYLELEKRGLNKNLGLDGARRLKRKARQMKSLLSVLPCKEPSSLKAELRPYQKEGLGWLQEIGKHRLGGILADDMGLGKTIQVLSHFQKSKESGELKAPALVVCPRSVVDVWLEEAKRFTPELKLLRLTGSDRANYFDDLSRYDLIVSTYGLIPKDVESLKKVRFFCIIADEAQNIKNFRTQAARSLKRLNSGHRLCLTGTPIENQLLELWSQFDFLLPGLLGDRKSFAERFTSAPSKKGFEEGLDALKETIAPFVLRRMKEDVAPELPRKTTIIKRIELDDSQRDLYETVRLSTHRSVREIISVNGLAKSQIHVLAALTKLRQVCCDPGLVPDRKGEKPITSSKLVTLFNMLRELLLEGRKIIVFSQFASMLEIISDALDGEGISHSMLTGATQNRKEQVDRFQSGVTSVFLVSLKAGGSGLTLTAADTVIHYDPWWNPQVESQATDRAYRIGQDKPVFVYKLIAKGTVEEKIVALQEEKAVLARDVLDFSTRRSRVISEEDLDTLLAPISNG